MIYIITMKAGRRFLILFIIWYPAIKLFAGVPAKIDSLEQIVISTNDIHTKTDALIELTRLYWNISPEKSVFYGKQAYSLALKQNDKRNATTSLLYRAVAEYYTGNYDSCIVLSKKAIQLSPVERQSATNSFAYNLISISYKNLGDFDKALDYAKKSYEIRKKTTDTVNIAGSLDNIAHIYRKTGNYEKAIEYSFKALALFQSTSDTMEITRMYASLANLYNDMEKPDSALVFFKHALKLLAHHELTITYADIQFSIGDILLTKQQYDTALWYFNKSLAVYQQRGVKSGVADVYVDMAQCYSAKGEFKKALGYIYNVNRYYRNKDSKIDLIDLEQLTGDVFMKSGRFDSSEYYLRHAYNLSRKINYAHGIVSNLKSLSLLYEKAGNPKALPVFKQYIAYRDSINGKEIQMKLEELKTKYEISKKEKKILKLKILSKTEKAKNQLVIFTLIVLALVLYVMLIYFFFKRRKDRIICHQKNIIAHKNEMLAKSQLEKSRILSKRLKEKLNYQTRQLTTHSLNMIQKSKLLQDINTKLDEMIDADRDSRNKILNQLKSELAHSLKSENDWTLFKMYFEQINKGFIDKLKKIKHDLTENEIRLCALIKIGMSLKETASIMNISPNSVKNARHRLKTKLGLKAEEDLNAFIGNL